MSSDKTTAPFRLSDDAPVRTTWRHLIVIGGLLATGFGSWVLLRADVADQGKRLVAVEARSATDHDIILEIRADMKALLREQRTNRP